LTGDVNSVIAKRNPSRKVKESRVNMMSMYSKNPFAGKTSKGEFHHLKGRLALGESIENNPISQNSAKSVKSRGSDC